MSASGKREYAEWIGGVGACLAVRWCGARGSESEMCSVWLAMLSVV